MRNNTKKAIGHKKKWSRPDIPTMKCFLGILLYMGIVRKPCFRDYWTKDSLYEIPLFKNVISYDHFQQIRSNLHVVDEDLCDKTDPIYKVRPLVDYIIAVSQSVYTPEKDLTIDESMIKFNGRSSFKVYICH